LLVEAFVHYQIIVIIVIAISKSLICANVFTA